MRSTSIQFSRRLLGAAVIAGSIVAVSSGAQQTGTVRGGQRRGATAGQAASPIAVAHATFERAARIMESALPIYDGHRHRAIELAKHAAKEIKEAAMGASSSATATGASTATGTTGTSSRSGTTGGASGVQHKTAAQQAAAIPKGSNVPLTNYNSAQIAASNAKMQQGLQLLQQGLQEVQAIGNDPGNHMSDALEFGNYAVQAANAGLAFVQSKL